MRYRFGKSKAGHDKNRVYRIVSEDDKYYYVCDDTHHSDSNPKKKNKKHIQPIK